MTSSLQAALFRAPLSTQNADQEMPRELPRELPLEKKKRCFWHCSQLITIPGALGATVSSIANWLKGEDLFASFDLLAAFGCLVGIYYSTKESGLLEKLQNFETALQKENSHMEETAQKISHIVPQVRSSLEEGKAQEKTLLDQDLFLGKAILDLTQEIEALRACLPPNERKEPISLFSLFQKKEEKSEQKISTEDFGKLCQRVEAEQKSLESLVETLCDLTESREKKRSAPFSFEQKSARI